MVKIAKIKPLGINLPQIILIIGFSLCPEMVQADTETPHQVTLKQISESLKMSQEVVEALLSDLKTGDSCTVEPYTDSFTYTHGYILLWCFIIELCGEAHVALRFQYASWLKNNGHLEVLLNSMFKLMPTYVVHGDGTRDFSALFESYGSLSLKGNYCTFNYEY